MRLLLALAFASVAAAGRFALLFSNRTVAESVIGERPVVAVTWPRRELVPPQAGDAGAFWTSESFLNCSEPQPPHDPCHPEKPVVCRSAKNDATAVNGASSADRYALLVTESPDMWKAWRCKERTDVLQSVRVEVPGMPAFRGWQSTVMHALLVDHGGGVYLSMHSG